MFMVLPPSGEGRREEVVGVALCSPRTSTEVRAAVASHKAAHICRHSVQVVPVPAHRHARTHTHTHRHRCVHAHTHTDTHSALTESVSRCSRHALPALPALGQHAVATHAPHGGEEAGEVGVEHVVEGLQVCVNGLVVLELCVGHHLAVAENLQHNQLGLWVA